MRLHILLLAETSLKAPQVFKREAACFEQMRHEGSRRSAEQRKQVIDQPVMSFLAADHGLEDMSVSDLASAAQCSAAVCVATGCHRPSRFRLLLVTLKLLTICERLVAITF